MRILASIVATLLLAASGFATQASELYRKAEKLEKAGKIVSAFLLYAQAAELEPANPRYLAKAKSLQAKADYQQLQSVKAAAAAAAKPTPAKPSADEPAVDNPSPDIDLDPDFESITARELEKSRQMLPPPHLNLVKGRFDFHFTGDSKMVFDKVAERCGLQTEYDSEYTPQKVRLDIEDVDCRDALRAAEAATNSFIATLSSKLIFISKDTVQKRQANEQTMSVVIPVPTALTVQDLTEISQAVKQVSGVEKLAWNAASNEIVIRDRISRVQIAQAVVEQLTSFRGGVVFDLRFLELSDSDLITYGVNLTNSFNINWVGGLQNAVNSTATTAGVTLNAFVAALRQAPYAFGISALNASIVATLTDSNSRTILATTIRALNGMPATLHVGNKYPVLTSGYFGPSSSTTSTSNTGTAGTAYTPPPSFTYEDLGVSLKVIPVIGNNDLITLDVESEYQLLAGNSINGIPILANRKLSTRISIHNDEWAVIGGLTDTTDNKSVSGVAGLARIPILGWLFKTQTCEKDRDHVVIVMKPHIVGEPPANHETSPMPVGTETRPLSPI